METTTINNGRAAEAWKYVLAYGQSESNEGKK